jgi:hypothetical protein
LRGLARARLGDAAGSAADREAARRGIPPEAESDTRLFGPGLAIG